MYELNDLVLYMMKQQMFELKEGKDVFVKNKDYHSAIGLQDDEIFIRCDFLEDFIKRILKDFVDLQLKDLNLIRSSFN